MSEAQQRSLFNFGVGDPFNAPTKKQFIEQYAALHGKKPLAPEFNLYYEKHPDAFQREHGESWAAACRRVKGGRA